VATDFFFGCGVVLLFLYRDGNQCVDEMRGWSRCVGVVDPTGSTVWLLERGRKRNVQCLYPPQGVGDLERKAWGGVKRVVSRFLYAMQCSEATFIKVCYDGTAVHGTF
jgi:hypothetical protein